MDVKQYKRRRYKWLYYESMGFTKIRDEIVCHLQQTVHMGRALLSGPITAGWSVKITCTKKRIREQHFETEI